MEINDARFQKLEDKQKRLARLCLGIAIVAFLTVLIAVFASNKANSAKDSALKTEAATAAKLAKVAAGVTAQNTVRIYESAVREHDDCITAVENSLNNRGQHEAIVISQQTERNAFLTAFPNGVDFINESFDKMKNDLLSGPLLSTEPRNINECPDLPKPLDPAVVALAVSIVDEAEEALAESTSTVED